MSQIHADEFEHLGQELDRTVRTVATGLAQLVEQVQRRNADNARSQAAALREQIAQAAAVQRQRPTVPASTDADREPSAPFRLAGQGRDQSVQPLAPLQPGEWAPIYRPELGGHPDDLIGDAAVHRTPHGDVLVHLNGGQSLVDGQQMHHTTSGRMVPEQELITDLRPENLGYRAAWHQENGEVDTDAFYSAAERSDWTDEPVAGPAIYNAGDAWLPVELTGHRFGDPGHRYYETHHGDLVPEQWVTSNLSPENIYLAEWHDQHGRVDPVRFREAAAAVRLDDSLNPDLLRSPAIHRTADGDVPVELAYNMVRDDGHRFYEAASGHLIPEEELVTDLRAEALGYRAEWHRPNGYLDHDAFIEAAREAARQNPWRSDMAAEVYQRVPRDVVQDAAPSTKEQLLRDWASAAERMAIDPSPANIVAHAEAAELLRRRHGVDAAAVLGDALGDSAAAVADARGSGQVIIPANGANPDRNLAPSMAQTPEEAEHRRQAWAAARDTYEGGVQLRGDSAAPSWEQLGRGEQRQRFWEAYDRPEVRTVASPDPAKYQQWLEQNGPAPRNEPAAAAKAAVGAPAVVEEERGFRPSQASTPEERARRTQAWDTAKSEFVASLPEGTSTKAANEAWRQLDFKDKLPVYWAAYDSIERPAPPAPVTRERIVELNNTAAEFYGTKNTPGSPGRDYFQDRIGPDFDKLGATTGYAPGPAAGAGWTSLTGHLRKQGATNEEIVAAGLGTVSSRGNVIDTFRDRAVLGIRSAEGDLVGFVGRDLSGNDRAPKYVNTTATAAFSKGDELYGLAEAAPGAKLVRAEGPFDALAISAASTDRSVAGVAPLGTAMTGNQADLLAERSPDGRVWLALDNDAAGAKAAAADFTLLSRNGLDVRELRYEGPDPAQAWKDNPEQLRSATAQLDRMPSAAFTAVSEVIEDKADAIRGGDVDAFDDLYDAQQRAKAAMPEAEREQLQTFFTERLAGIVEDPDAYLRATQDSPDRDSTPDDQRAAAVDDLEQARADRAEARDVAGSEYDAADDHREAAADLEADRRADPNGIDRDLDTTQEIVVTEATVAFAAESVAEHEQDRAESRDGLSVATTAQNQAAETHEDTADRAARQARAADARAAGAEARGSGPGSTEVRSGYERANPRAMRGIDPEAVQARETSAHGYSQSTSANIAAGSATKLPAPTAVEPGSGLGAANTVGRAPRGPRPTRR